MDVPYWQKEEQRDVRNFLSPARKRISKGSAALVVEGRNVLEITTCHTMEEKYTFSKSERLYHKKEIQELFSKGSSFYLFPFRILYRPAASSEVHQVLITVSKRSFKKAVDRNRIKRRIREAYRLNKHLLAEVPPLQLGFIYTAKEKVSYADIENGMKRGLLRLGRNQLPDQQ